MPLPVAEIHQILTNLRSQAVGAADKLGSHQLNAHWSLAYACRASPEAWEMYRAAPLHLMPCTQFFVNHEAEITEALRQEATWELLHEHAVEKLRFDTALTEDERRECGHFARNVQFYDPQIKRWTAVDVPAISWFDNREQMRESLETSSDEVRARIETRLANLRKRTEANPTAAQKAKLQEFERFVEGQFQVNMKKRGANNPSVRRYLAKLDTTKDFRKMLFGLLRAAENRVRAARGIAAIGETWVSETELLYRVRTLFPEHEVAAHGQPHWLGRQHLDIWLPTLQVGIEYQGIQHFEPVGRFGGDSGLERVQERDARKRTLCEKHGVRLIEIAYDQTIGDAELMSIILNSPSRS